MSCCGIPSPVGDPEDQAFGIPQRLYLRTATPVQTGVPIVVNVTKSDQSQTAGTPGSSNGAGGLGSLLINKAAPVAPSSTPGRNYAILSGGGQGVACVFLSPPLEAQSIEGDAAFSIGFGPMASQVTQRIRIGWYVYVYRPSTGAVVGVLVDGGDPIDSLPYFYPEDPSWIGPPIPPAGASFSHSFVFTKTMNRVLCQTGDLLVAEMWEKQFDGSGVPTFIFNGYTEYGNADTFAEINQASYINLSVALLGQGSNVYSTNVNFTATDVNDIILVDANLGARTVSLPAAASVPGHRYSIKKIDASANVVTIDGDGAETIDGAATLPLSTQWAVATIISDGANWLTL